MLKLDYRHMYQPQELFSRYLAFILTWWLFSLTWKILFQRTEIDVSMSCKLLFTYSFIYFCPCYLDSFFYSIIRFLLPSWFQVWCIMIPVSCNMDCNTHITWQLAFLICFNLLGGEPFVFIFLMNLRKIIKTLRHKFTHALCVSNWLPLLTPYLLVVI